MFCPASAVSYAKLHGAHFYHSYAVISKKSRVHNPESRVQNTESRVGNPESRVHSILKEHERWDVKSLDLEIIDYKLSKTDYPISWKQECV